MIGTGCVVFDIDDTLYLERDYVRSGFEAVGHCVYRRFGIHGFFERAWAAFEDGCRGTIFDRALDESRLEPSRELIEELVGVYRSHIPRISLLPDARNTLELLSRSACLGVVTDGPIDSQRAKATALGIRHWMVALILTEELGPGFGKPHPRAFEILEHMAGWSGSDCLYVADNPNKDFSGPKRLGWKTVRVRRHGALHEAVPSGVDVDTEIEDLNALTEILEVRS